MVIITKTGNLTFNNIATLKHNVIFMHKNIRVSFYDFQEIAPLKSILQVMEEISGSPAAMHADSSLSTCARLCC